MGFLFTQNADASLRPGSVIYGVVPCLFGMPCLKSVVPKLSYLKNQGVDVLWISPIYETDDPSLISYATTDYLKVRADHGTSEDLKNLVTKAHKLGLKVILDIVPNHTSNAHPNFVEAEKLGKKSPYFDFYERDENGKATFYFNWENLPNLNFSNPKVVNMIDEAFLKWINDFGIDGYRVDAAWGVKTRAPGYWPRLIKKLKRKNPDLIMLAEAGARDSYFHASGFDIAYDWTEDLGKWSWEKVFINPENAPKVLDSAIKASLKNSPNVARFLNNNDTGKRFITRYGLKFTRLGALIQHTVPGVPIVYMGDENGARFDPYEDPAPISWDDPNHLMPFYKRLAEIREEYKSIHSGDWKTFSLKSDKPVYAYTRTFKNETTLVLMNFGAEKTKSFFKLPADIKSPINLMIGETLMFKTLPDGIEVLLEGKSALIIGQR